MKKIPFLLLFVSRILLEKVAYSLINAISFESKMGYSVLNVLPFLKDLAFISFLFLAIINCSFFEA